MSVLTRLLVLSSYIKQASTQVCAVIDDVRKRFSNLSKFRTALVAYRDITASASVAVQLLCSLLMA